MLGQIGRQLTRRIGLLGDAQLVGELHVLVLHGLDLEKYALQLCGRGRIPAKLQRGKGKGDDYGSQSNAAQRQRHVRSPQDGAMIHLWRASALPFVCAMCRPRCEDERHTRTRARKRTPSKARQHKLCGVLLTRFCL